MKRKRRSLLQRREIFDKTGGRCYYCGCELPFEDMRLDHMVSLHNHGEDEMDNLVPSCQQCNYYKRGSNPEGFRRKLKRAFARENKCDYVKALEKKYEGWNGKFFFERTQEKQ